MLHWQALSLYPRNLSLLQLLEVLESRAHAYVRLQQVGGDGVVFTAAIHG